MRSESGDAMTLRAWEVTATPRGVECGLCGKPGQYAFSSGPEGRRCHDCCASDSRSGPRVRVDVATPGPRTLIVYAPDEAKAHFIAQEAGYSVDTIKRYVPVTSKVVDERKAPGA